MTTAMARMLSSVHHILTGHARTVRAMRSDDMHSGSQACSRQKHTPKVHACIAREVPPGKPMIKALLRKFQKGYEAVRKRTFAS